MAAFDSTTSPAETARWSAVGTATAAFAGFGTIGVLLAWVNSLDALFGVPMDHPISLLFMFAMALTGAIGALAARRQRGELHPEVKKLADAGEKARAIQLLSHLKGLSVDAATQQIERYLAAPGELHAEVKKLADAGEKIRAIQLLRDLTGLGLAEAKDAVERYLASRPGKPA